MMKNDINLLQKRKTKQLSSQRIVTILVVLLFIAGALFAGIALPSQALSAIKLTVADLDYEIVSSSHIEQELIEKTAQNKALTEQIESLGKLSESKSDVLAYIETVERCLPTEANLTQMNFSEDELNMIGVAKNDAVVAAFSLRLRDTNMFDSVFIINSITIREDLTSFTLKATLPFTLASADTQDVQLSVTSDGSEEKDGE
jgi:Tfp pilus assembly protein PilN